MYLLGNFSSECHTQRSPISTIYGELWSCLPWGNQLPFRPFLPPPLLADTRSLSLQMEVCLGCGLSCLPLLVAWQMALPQSIINRNVLARRLSHLSHMLNALNGTRGNYIGACTRCCLSVCLSVSVEGSRTFTCCLSLPLSRALSLSYFLSLFFSPFYSLLPLSFPLCLCYKRNLSSRVCLINYITNIDYNILYIYIDIYRFYWLHM